VSLFELRVYAVATDPARYSCEVEQPVLLALLDVAAAAASLVAAAEIDCPEGPEACGCCASRQALAASVELLREVT
jgi:hypothetical protein